MMLYSLLMNCHIDPLNQEMDVSHSMDVTDAGIKVLCNPETFLEEEGNKHCACANASKSLLAAKRSRKISAPASCIVWLPRLVRGIRRHSVVQQQQQSSNRTGTQHFSINEEDDSHILWPEDEKSVSPSETFTEPPLSCIRSLRRLDVHDTKVTSEGLKSILNAASPDIILLS